MICPQCQEVGGRSQVTLSEQRLIPDGQARQFWDEDGVHHVHDGSVVKTAYQCTAGHGWVIDSAIQQCAQGDFP